MQVPFRFSRNSTVFPPEDLPFTPLAHLLSNHGCRNLFAVRVRGNGASSVIGRFNFPKTSKLVLHRFWAALSEIKNHSC